MIAFYRLLNTWLYYESSFCRHMWRIYFAREQYWYSMQFEFEAKLSIMLNLVHVLFFLGTVLSPSPSQPATLVCTYIYSLWAEWVQNALRIKYKVVVFNIIFYPEDSVIYYIS